MYNVVSKTIGYWRFYWGSRNGFKTQVGEISVHVYGLTVFKALKPLPVVKTDADGKP
jgi:lysyl-tRNA synthetase class 2